MIIHDGPLQSSPKGFTSIAIKEFARTGALFRSSGATAKRVAQLIPPSALTVVEYGAGDGVISKAILRRVNRHARLYGIEILDDFFSQLLRIDDPRFDAVHGSVVDLSSRLKELAGASPQVVVSGIPFSFLNPSERENIVANTFDSLAPGGIFIVYQVTPRMKGLLKKYFPQVRVELEPLNVPPCFIMTATKGE